VATQGRRRRTTVGLPVVGPAVRTAPPVRFNAQRQPRVGPRRSLLRPPARRSGIPPGSSSHGQRQNDDLSIKPQDCSRLLAAIGRGSRKAAGRLSTSTLSPSCSTSTLPTATTAHYPLRLEPSWSPES